MNTRTPVSLAALAAALAPITYLLPADTGTTPTAVQSTTVQPTPRPFQHGSARSPAIDSHQGKGPEDRI